MSQAIPNNKSSISQKASIMVVSRAVTIASQMASIIILTRLLSKETFGLLSFLLLAFATVTTLAQLGLPESIFYFFERVSSNAKKSFVLLTSKVLFFIGIGASLILVAFNYLAPLLGFEVQGLFLPLIFLLLLELPVTPLTNALIAIDNARAAAWFNIASGVLQFGALVTPVLLGFSLEAIVTCLVIYGAIRFLFGTILFFKNFKGERGDLPPGMLKEQFRYSIPLGLSQILWGLNRQIDKYVVAAFLPLAAFAEYTVGSWEIPLIPAIAYSVASVMMPNLVSFHLDKKITELLELWNKAIRKVSIIVLPLVVLFLIMAEEFIVLVFSEKYIAAAVPFRIYTLIILQRVAAYSSMLKAIGETRVIIYSAIYMVIINAVLSVPLVIWLGMMGPPLATLLANIFTWGYALRKISGALDVTVSQVFPFRFYLKALSISSIAGITAWILKENWGWDYQAKLLGGILIFLAVYIIFASLARLISKEDLTFFKIGNRHSRQ